MSLALFTLSERLGESEKLQRKKEKYQSKFLLSPLIDVNGVVGFVYFGVKAKVTSLTDKFHREYQFNVHIEQQQKSRKKSCK